MTQIDHVEYGRARVFGNGYTTMFFNWPGGDNHTKQTHAVGFAQQVSHTSPAPVVEPQVIQAMNHLHPVEIVSPRAVHHGTIVISLMEIWHRPIWDFFAGLAGSNSLQEILTHVSNRDGEIFLQTQISVPQNASTKGSSGQDNTDVTAYTLTYHGCVVADIRDDDQIDVTTMNLAKQITFWYRWCDFDNRSSTFPDDLKIG